MAEDFLYASRSAVGLVRKDNEDSVYVDVPRGLFAVADGMGGGAEGARASRMVCAALERFAVSDRFTERLDQIRAAIDAANGEIVAYAHDRHLRQMGTTVALIAFETEPIGRAAIAYIGDSRVYRLRDGAAELLTRDHSVGAELDARVGGALGGRFADRANPLAHVLTRAIGIAPKVEIAWRKIDLKPHDAFLVCTDGVHDVLATDELSQIIGADDLAGAAKRLEDEIVRKGAPDNYSFILMGTGDFS